MKRLSFLILICTFVALIVSGCGHVKSAKKLIKMAKRQHGKCEVISKTETDDKTVVRLKDELQGFEYEIISSMHDINIDGSSFGSLPHTSDTFSQSLVAYVLGDAKNELDAICQKYNATYESGYIPLILRITVKGKAQDSNAIKVCEETASVLQKYNQENRMDKMTVYVEHDNEWFKAKYGTYDINNYDPDYSYLFSSQGSSEAKHIGSAVLPDCRFRDKEKEDEDYYLEMAQMKNKNATFVRKEKKTFADTGASLDIVMNSIDGKSPEKMSDPVTFYYFQADGKEFYICDFLDYNIDTWYTNYDQIFPKK